MCFTHDYDWHAEVVEQSSGPATAVIRCDECGEDIPIGVVRHHVYQQQYEECHTCYCGECSCPRVEVDDQDAPDGCCVCPEPDFGETYDYDPCESCDRFLRAVEAAEVAAGCHRSEARPYLGGMCEDIGNGGREEARRYFRAALQLYPELRASGYLGRLWRRMFG